MRHWQGLIELLVVLLFAAGWAILEWVASRMPRTGEQAAPSEGDSRHPERQ
jgi:hypothetical protein